MSGRFRSSSLGAGAIILAFLLLLLHRYGTFLLFLVIGGGLLWYGRIQREAEERAAKEAGRAGAASGGGTGAPEAEVTPPETGADPAPPDGGAPSGAEEVDGSRKPGEGDG